MKKMIRFAKCTALLSTLALGAHALAETPLVAAASAATASAAAAVGAASTALPPDVFAQVGDIVITRHDYNVAFTDAARGKFYHGNAPEGEVAQLQREVADKLVARVLLLREARRRGLEPDHAEIKKTLNAYEERYAKSPEWLENREQVLPLIKERMEEDSLLKRFEKSIKTMPEPQVEEIEAYYRKHPDKFTEPERVRVSSILLKVDPASPPEFRKKAEEVGKDIHKRLKNNTATFEAMARENSDDPSGRTGGDMGYIHQGMLPEMVQETLAKMKEGDMTEPLHLIEGVVILKLTERVPPKLLDFGRVQARAKGLLRRDKAEQAWTGLIEELKKATPTRLDDSGFLPLAEKAAEAGAAPK